MPSTTDYAGYAQIINAIIGAYGALKSHKPQTVNDPLNDALRARIYGFIDNSPTRNMLGGMLGDYVKGGANSTWTPAPAKYGYNPYPNGVPKYDLSGILPMLGGGSGASTTTPTGGGGIPTGNPAGGPATGLGGLPSVPNMPTNLSSGDRGAFTDFVSRYGKAAGEAVIAIITGNPMIGVQAAIDAYKAHSGGQPTPALPSSNRNYPQDILAPGGKPPSLNTPYDQWFPPQTNDTMFNPQYAGGAGPGYYDPKGGAGAIGNLLGQQMGSSDGKGPKKF